MKKTERIMHRAPRSAARASRARTAVCNRYNKFVTGRNPVSVTVNSVINQLLRLACNTCNTCNTFFKFILGLLQNSVLFHKKNFNLKTPVTPVTALETPAIARILAIPTCYTTCYNLLQTALYLLQHKNIELFVDRISRISDAMSTNHENRLTLRAHRSILCLL